MLANVVIGTEPQAAPVVSAPVVATALPAGFATSPAAALAGGDVALAEPAALAAGVGLAQPYRPEEIDPKRPETWGPTPRNAACPCGSGRKYKYCHGRV